MNNRWQFHGMITLGLFLILLSTSVANPASQSGGATTDAGMLNDGQMHVVLCGTGSPLPDANRAQACTAIIAGGEFVLVDKGSGSWRKVAVNNLPAQDLSAILLTHFHSDHIGDLGEALMQSWAAGRNQKLNVYGPGVEQVVAASAKVETLVFTHIVPPPNSPQIEQAFTRGVSDIFKGKVVLGTDGMRFDLPPRN